MHTAEGAELWVAYAVARVSAKILGPKGSRHHCLAQAAQLNMLETLLAADLRRSVPTGYRGIGNYTFFADDEHVLCYHADHVDP